MKKNGVPLTVDVLEKVLDRKLEEVLDKKLDEKLDEKLKPIQDDITWIKSDLSNVKDVLENRVFKEMKEGFRDLNKKIDRLEDINVAHIQDYEDHETRILRLEKHVGIPPKN